MYYIRVYAREKLLNIRHPHEQEFTKRRRIRLGIRRGRRKKRKKGNNYREWLRGREVQKREEKKEEKIEGEGRVGEEEEQGQEGGGREVEEGE